MVSQSCGKPRSFLSTFGPENTRHYSFLVKLLFLFKKNRICPSNYPTYLCRTEQQITHGFANNYSINLSQFATIRNKTTSSIIIIYLYLKTDNLGSVCTNCLQILQKTFIFLKYSFLTHFPLQVLLIF
jgi:hypothetical protein